jgi:hypothetical protein
MREHITADSIASTIRMLRTTFSGAFLIVEGDTDARFWKRFIDHAACQIQLAHCRDKVITVVSILDKAGFLGHLGLVDRDFGPELGEQFASDNLIAADENDIELMIFNSDVFDRFVAEYANSDKVSAIEGQEKSELRELVVANASQIGVLRILSKKLQWNLDFDGMTVRYVGRREVKVDLDAQIDHLRGRSHGTPMPVGGVVKSAIAVQQESRADSISHVCGHDLCEIISKGVHDVFGRAGIALARGGIAVEEVFRAAFTDGNLKGSSIYPKIRQWEQTHRPFRILPA